MFLRKWNELPEDMKTPEVKKYYDILAKHRISLFLKRIFDIILSFIMLLILAFPMALISLLIVFDSPGGVFYRQVRITAYGEKFRIHKFRTMIKDADKVGSLVTVVEDKRITKIGKFLRKYRLDEMPQLFDVLFGKMSFVGTRPEVPKYVKKYTNEMKATLLLPAGITSEASIRYKDEAKLLDETDDIDGVYVEKVLKEKMRYNLKAVERFSLAKDMMTMIRTVFVVLGRKYK
ncbi:sugar transferase [Claveliimonas bilis]|uniref:Glycosyl transferase n=1 Tax=Claveliimonas bilis TaxID=3028070 RepID=A0ABN6YZE6_9FIRM|nr:sugar transferase [Claveliimonas bilis]BDZ76285.1 glycosyl transferase [Claveliimonas bilis]